MRWASYSLFTVQEFVYDIPRDAFEMFTESDLDIELAIAPPPPGGIFGTIIFW